MRNKAILLFSICFTLQDLKDVECKTWCKMNSYDSGVFTNGHCWCANKIIEERIKQKKLSLPHGIRKSNSTPIHFNFPFPEVTKLPWE